jgi:hypothetical protein
LNSPGYTTPSEYLEVRAAAIALPCELIRIQSQPSRIATVNLTYSAEKAGHQSALRRSSGLQALEDVFSPSVQSRAHLADENLTEFSWLKTSAGWRLGQGHDETHSQEVRKAPLP